MKNNSKTKTASKPAGPRAKTKAQIILCLLNRSTGATLAELSKATKWQPHSVRGFLSGTVRKRMGLPLHSMKDDKGVRRYSIQSDGDTV